MNELQGRKTIVGNSTKGNLLGY